MQPVHQKHLRFPQQNHNKISLTHQPQPSEIKKDLSMDNDLVNAAINKSYLKKMVGSDTLKAEEVVNTVANFLLSFLTPANVEKELEEFWCIVALNEDTLHVEDQFCSCSTNTSIGSYDINSLKLYQLFIGLGSK